MTVIVLYNQIKGVKPFAIYAFIDITKAGAMLWILSRARWAIEVLFRALKESLGFEGLTVGGEEGAHLSVCIPLILATSNHIDSKVIWDAIEKESLGN